jgi:SPP1 gp7 family putative phage head morphogenesis protein
VLAKPWAPDGSNFSARIWKDRDKLVSELQTILTQDLIRGEPAEKVISDFAERMGVSRHAAERLIRTEAAYFAGQSRMDAYREMGVEQYKFVATLDRRTSEICRDMDGRVFRLSEARAGVNYPPLHVYCRSTTIPHFEDAEPGERAARSDDGDTYYVPGDMTYREWAEQHAPAAAEPASASVPRPVEPSVVRQVPQEPRRFSSEQEATEWIDDVSPNWLTELTPEEKTAVRIYSGIDYRRINQYLRSGSEGDAELDRLISNLSEALRKFELQEPIVVYRGLDSNIFGVSDPQQLIGAVINEKAFISTSLLSEKAFDGPVRIEMRLPAGKYGAAIIPLSDYPEEYEFLLDRGLSYVILDARDEDGILILVVEVLLDGDQT